jgi:hypothetical protein
MTNHDHFANGDFKCTEIAQTDAPHIEAIQTEPAPIEPLPVEPVIPEASESEASDPDAGAPVPVVDSAPAPAAPDATPKRPVSERRLAANRANAQKSTGPRTPEGKSRSALNATRHGILSQVLHLPEEELEAYPNSPPAMSVRSLLSVKPKLNSPELAPISSSAFIASLPPSTISSPSVTKNMAIAGIPVIRNRMPR